MTPTHSPPRQIRKDFDLEPNPFEQSFSVRPNSNLRTNNSSPSNSKSRSVSPDSDPRPILPPLASIASNSDPSTYNWSFPTTNLANSLRDGPLSPAMLAGPQSQQHSDQFDSYRTGLTPRSGLTPRTGLTPATGLTPLVAPSAPFPPSPNTAAFLALMTNNNNNTSSTSPATQTITPNTLNAITGALNPPSTNHYPHHPSQLQNSHTEPNTSYNPSNAATTAANGLFLLSQAHQELTKREEAQRANANGSANGKRGTKRKSYDVRAAISPPPPPRSNGKRTRAATRRKPSSPRVSDDLGGEDDDEDEDDEDDGADDGLDLGGRRGNKKPETEEEKRRNFLERNRQAALKCRQRKKAWLAQLQAKVEFLSNENERLTSALVSSREEISRLSALVGSAAVGGPGVPHMSSGVGLVGAAGGGGAQPVSINVSLSSKPVAAGAGSNRSGYGY